MAIFDQLIDVTNYLQLILKESYFTVNIIISVHPQINDISNLYSA